MGQLEKYGLYVLCLVIFLILGVTIWGGGELPQPPRRTGPGTSSELNANPRTAANEPTNGGSSSAVRPPNNPAPTPATDVLSLLQPVAPPTEPRRNESRPVDASIQKPGGDPAKTAADATKPPAKNGGEASKPPADAARPTHKIARGETFDSIAREKLGAASLRSEIARLNPRVDPSKMQVGQELVLPTAAEVEALSAKGKKSAPVADRSGSGDKKPSTEPGTYTIAKGDTFELIARRELGSSKRVNELRELNSDIDPTRLRIGMQIRLPKK